LPTVIRAWLHKKYKAKALSREYSLKYLIGRGIIMEIIQVLVTVFALFAMSRAWLRFKDNKLTKNEVLFWTALWLAVIIVIFIPHLTTVISQVLGIGRGTDLVLYVSAIVLFYLVFRLYVKLESLERNVSEVVRKIAIKKEEEKKKK
jgi:hypothetical protein